VPLPLELHRLAQAAQASARPARDTFAAEWRLPAGSFDIVLCVDTTETRGGAAGGRKSLKEETLRHLAATAVPYNERALNIGDFLWVARERTAEVAGRFRQAPPRELVLPFLVERKRQDDLWASIKDGRYEEQKFRMKNSGLEHLFYLVEEHPTKKDHWGRAGAEGGLVTTEAMEQAVANTAVQEGFTVKRTADQRASTEFLTLITRLLREKYASSELSCVTHVDLEEGRVASRDTSLLEFAAFNEASKKTKRLTIR
jgi:crossover junction endonuclease MUS81